VETELAEKLKAVGVYNLVVKCNHNEGEATYTASQIITASDKYCQLIQLQSKTLCGILETASAFYNALHNHTQEK